MLIYDFIVCIVFSSDGKFSENEVEKMKDINEIRDDLKEIRYYYNRASIFEEGEKVIGLNDVYNKVELYNSTIRRARPMLYDIYIGLYVHCLTQHSLALEMGYTREYIQQLNKEVLVFFQKNL